MDPKYTGEILRHLEKQDELLMDAYRSMSHELHKLQVEEEMLMRGFYDLMVAQGLAKKKQDGMNVSEEREAPQSKALVVVDGQQTEDDMNASEESVPPQSKALVLVDSQVKE